MREGWKKVPLAGLCKVFTDGDWIETKNQSSEGIRLVQTGNVGTGEFKDRRDKARFISEETFDRLKCQEVYEGDCLISRLPDPVGRSCIIPGTDDKMITAVDCTIVRFDATKVIPEFFNYYSQSSLYLQDIESYCTGATRKRISRKNLGNIAIPVPPLPEQKRIVAILDEAFAGIEKAIANTENSLANARELFESYLDSVFFVKCPATHRESLTKLCEPKTITYGVIKLGQHIDDGVPCLRTSNVRRLNIETEGMKRIAPALSHQYGRTILQGGEVLVNIRGTLGGVAVAGENMKGWNVSREVAVVPLDQKRILPSFAAYCIATKASQDWLVGVQKGVAYTGINLTDLRELPIYLPELNKQASIVAQLDEMYSHCCALELLHQQKLTALAELKQSLLQKAFSGELTASANNKLKEAAA